jgi:hypothetical protein
MQRQIQQGVYLTNKRKLLYKTSFLKKIYPPNGLTLDLLLEHNNSHKDKILTIYRNLIRSIKYLQFHKYTKNLITHLIKIKIRQDYSYKRSILLNSTYSNIPDIELYQRLINTVNFIHNAALDDIDNKTARPISMEFKILNAIVEFENSKSIPESLKKRLNCNFNFLTLKNYIDWRNIEKSWNFHKDDNIKRENVWWIDHDLGIIKNEICFQYLKELQSFDPKIFNEMMVISIIDFERSLVLLNEEMKLLL